MRETIEYNPREGHTFCGWCCRPVHYAADLVSEVPDWVLCGRPDCGYAERRRPTHIETRERMAEYYRACFPLRSHA